MSNDPDIQPIKQEIDKVIERFGKKYEGFELEIKTLAMVGFGSSY